MAVVDALRSRPYRQHGGPRKVEAELESAMEGSNYEGLGWNVFDAADRLDPRVQSSSKPPSPNLCAVAGPHRGTSLPSSWLAKSCADLRPRFWWSRFPMWKRRTSGLIRFMFGDPNGRPTCLSTLAGGGSNPDYRGKTTLVILPEFGRDPDGSSTNGFFNHRANEDSTRDTWMMALGAAVDRPTIIERPIRHIDLCPTLADLLGCRELEMQGRRLQEFRG